MSERDSNTVEEWRPVVGWEGFYEVSNLGRVRSLVRAVQYSDGRFRVYPENFLSPTNRRGYHVVRLSKKGRASTQLVNRLVLKSFVGPCPEGMETRHLNGDPLDNRLENLRWGTPLENWRDRVRHQTNHLPPVMRGEENTQSKITIGAARVIARLRRRVPIKWLAKQFGVSFCLISHIQNGRAWAWATEDIRKH